MRRIGNIVTVVAFYLCGSLSAYASCADDPSSKRVQAFVNRGFIHGVSSSEAKQFNSDRDVDTLVCLLHDPEESLYWQNVATVLGMSGNPRATSALINFVESGNGTISPESYQAKTAALMALGYLAPNDEKAMSYLRMSANPTAWENRSVKWNTPYGQTAEDRDADLSKQAILGLGLSGNRNAADFLSNLKRGEPVRLSSDFDDVITEALKTNETIQRKSSPAHEETR